MILSADGFPSQAPGSPASLCSRLSVPPRGLLSSLRARGMFSGLTILSGNHQQQDSTEGYTWFHDLGGGGDDVICSALFVWGPSRTTKLQFVSINGLSYFFSHFSSLFQVCFLDSPTGSSTSFQSVCWHVFLYGSCAKTLGQCVLHSLSWIQFSRTKLFSNVLSFGMESGTLGSLGLCL